MSHHDKVSARKNSIVVSHGINFIIFVSIVFIAPVIIRIPVPINIHHSIFLNHHVGFAILYRFVISVRHHITNIYKKLQKPIKYATIHHIHVVRFAGRIVHNNSAYVGLQLVKIGPKDAHRRISDHIDQFHGALLICGICFCILYRKRGRTRVSQYIIIMSQEIFAHSV